MDEIKPCPICGGTDLVIEDQDVPGVLPAVLCWNEECEIYVVPIPLPGWQALPRAPEGELCEVVTLGSGDHDLSAGGVILATYREFGHARLDAAKVNAAAHRWARGDKETK